MNDGWTHRASHTSQLFPLTFSRLFFVEAPSPRRWSFAAPSPFRWRIRCERSFVRFRGTLHWHFDHLQAGFMPVGSAALTRSGRFRWRHLANGWGGGRITVGQSVGHACTLSLWRSVKGSWWVLMHFLLLEFQAKIKYDALRRKKKIWVDCDLCLNPRWYHRQLDKLKHELSRAQEVCNFVQEGRSLRTNSYLKAPPGKVWMLKASKKHEIARILP